MASHPLPLQGGRGWGDWSPTHPLPLQKRNAAGETRHGKRSLSRNLSPTSVGQAGGRPSRPGPREGPARISPAALWKECRAQWIPMPVLQQWLGDRSWPTWTRGTGVGSSSGTGTGRRTWRLWTGSGSWSPRGWTSPPRWRRSPPSMVSRCARLPAGGQGSAAPAGEEVSRRRRRPEETPLEPRNTQLLVDAVDRFWAGFRKPAPPAPTNGRKLSRYFRRPQRGRGGR